MLFEFKYTNEAIIRGQIVDIPSAISSTRELMEYINDKNMKFISVMDEHKNLWLLNLRYIQSIYPL